MRSYGISVADVNNDGAYEFIVAGFGSENLALAYKENKLTNIVNDTKFKDKRVLSALLLAISTLMDTKKFTF